MTYPDDLYYTKEHEWLRLDPDGAHAYVGITDFAQHELDELVYVEVETVGEDLSAEDVFGTIEAVKTTSDLFMPVAGTVVEFNQRLSDSGGDNPGLVNSDCYGEGAGSSRSSSPTPPTWRNSCAARPTRSWSRNKSKSFLSLHPPPTAPGASSPSLRRPWALVPAAVTTAIVISLSLGNALQIETDWLDVPWIDKVQHFCAYACLGVLWSFAFRQNGYSAGLRLWGMLFALGVTLEVMQWAFYPNRFFEFGDMLANGLGAFAGVYLFLALLRTFPPKNINYGV